MNVPTRWILLALVVLCVVQVAVPARMLWDRESTLRHGEAFRFRCEPIDPVDALRGRYVVLGFEGVEVAHRGGAWSRDETRPARITVDDDGFARIAEVLEVPPDDAPWIPVRPRADADDDTDTVRVELPFDRFYMDEFDAPRAENALRRRGDERVDAWLVVRVRHGRAVPEMLYVGGVPVSEYLGDRDD